MTEDSVQFYRCTMHNVVLAQNAGHYNIRTSLAVLGTFGLITIISYFNELSK